MLNVNFNVLKKKKNNNNNNNNDNNINNNSNNNNNNNNNNNVGVTLKGPQLAFTCSKGTVETLE